MAASPPLRHVAMFPFMAKGHAMPLLHLARLLLGRRLASAVTFFTTPRNAAFIRAGLAGAGAEAAVVELPFPSEQDAPQSTDELPSSTRLVDFVTAVAALQPAFADALARIEPRPDLLVHDGFLRWAKDIADELGMPRLVTFGFGGFATYVSRAVTEHRPHAHVSSPSEPFLVHGLPNLRLTKADLNPPFDDPEPSGPHWDFICKNRISMYSSRGIIVNSFHELESVYIDLWNREFDIKMWPIGPLCLAASKPAVQTKDDLEISEWLDSRLALDRPVLYVAFGSQAELSRAQLEEIAVGLDNSGVDFLWVVRSKWLCSDYRFDDRFGDRGKVVEGFINQLGVLSHKSVKGFFTHCGWNSVLESIAMGVPILAFPMAAEQKLNAKFVVDVIHMGLRVWPKEDADKEGGGLVVSGDVQVLARELIFGEEGRRAAARASELSVSSRKTMEVGGSSFENLAKMVQEVSESETHANGE
ncbi:UDP-glycosyltransferase 90A1-like [Hordeum vulgare subsp. vulgare]|uniref:Glycosyltransferase n=1 Tax=Hordeum vulgare subsp. vulgare TaxID=112509 RepID=A0A8I6Y7D0_HORVV|nr:UDP-glycosyltransferase 90A1-like [Hordeum vulgare subsp. vulgare]